MKKNITQKEARKKKKTVNLAAEKRKKAAEGTTYEAGGF